MHRMRRGIAALRLADLEEQRGAQGFCELRGEGVGDFAGLADPLTKMIDVERRGY